MDYKKVYDSLIQKRRNEPLDKSNDGSIEKHHIIPKCLGGNDERENLINLTCREHRLAHLLLCKIYPKNHSLLCAALNMNYAIEQHQGRTTSKSRVYLFLRKQFSKWNVKNKSRYVEWNG